MFFFVHWPYPVFLKWGPPKGHYNHLDINFILLQITTSIFFIPFCSFFRLSTLTDKILWLQKNRVLLEKYWVDLMFNIVLAWQPSNKGVCHLNIHNAEIFLCDVWNISVLISGCTQTHRQQTGMVWKQSHDCWLLESLDWAVDPVSWRWRWLQSQFSLLCSCTLSY